MSSDETYRDIIAGRRRGPLAVGLRSLLRVASIPYHGITTVRNFCFDRGLRRVQAADVPVISIGNLTTGGTGKTPMVAAVVRMLQQLDRRPGIVSRGYRADASGVNDELRVLEHLCPGVPHVQNPDRIAAAAQIVAENQVDAIVLDDGFQHRRIARDLDLVLVDATNPFGFDFVLPRGLLRESTGGLRRADQVVITRCNQVSASRLSETEERIARLAPQHQHTLVRVSFRPASLLDLNGAVQPIARLDGVRVLLLTAIGNPQGFVETSRAAGARIAGTRFFPDHYHYSPADLALARAEAVEHQADLVLTTVKDLVKIRLLDQDSDSQPAIPLMALETATTFQSADEEEHLRSALGKALMRTAQNKG